MNVLLKSDIIDSKDKLATGGRGALWDAVDKNRMDCWILYGLGRYNNVSYYDNRDEKHDIEMAERI